MEHLFDFGMFDPVNAGLLASAAIALAVLGLGLWRIVARRSQRPASRSAEGGMIDSVRLGLPSGVLVVVIDHAGRIQFASQKAVLAMGMPEGSSWQGKVFTGLPCWDEPAEARHALARAILKAEMGKAQQLALTFTPGGAELNFIFELHPQISPAGNSRAVVITAMEMSSLLAAIPAALNPRHSAGFVESRRAGSRGAAAGFLLKADAKHAAALSTDSDSLGQREQASASKALVDSMLKLLPTSKTLDEALKIVASYLARMFPGTSGTLFMQKKGASGLHSLRSWGAAPSAVTRISSDDCWALRHSELHWVENPDVDLSCSHNEAGKSACLPLVVRGEMVGVLAMAWNKDATPDRSLLEAIAEPLAAALAQTLTNFALREQATKDPLTGLLNRQSLDTEFARLIHRAQEDSQPASVLMMDIDHFKAFNDRFGHDAGDLVLKSVATRIHQTVRTSDLAFRFGGEEIVVLLPCCGLDEAIVSAKRIQKGLTELTLVNRGERLPPVTISVGVATFPNDGVTAESLFLAADAGVYAAKAAGRNAVVHTEAARAA